MEGFIGGFMGDFMKESSSSIRFIKCNSLRSLFLLVSALQTISILELPSCALD